MALLHSARHDDPNDVEVIEMTPAEFEAAKQSALADLGVTYDELARQAEARRFESLQHSKLWLLIREY
jgi:hypothetical protein